MAPAIQMVKLIDEAQRAVAHDIALLLAQRRERLAQQRHAAGVGVVEPAQHVQQCRFARTGSTDDGHLLASVNAHIDATQDFDVQAALFETLGQALAQQDRRAGWRARALGAGLE